MKTLLHRGFGLAVDHVLCGSLALLHRRHARRVSSREAAERYFAECERLTRAQYFVLPATMENFHMDGPNVVSWRSPSLSAASFPMNETARVNLYRVGRD